MRENMMLMPPSRQQQTRTSLTRARVGLSLLAVCLPLGAQDSIEDALGGFGDELPMDSITLPETPLPPPVEDEAHFDLNGELSLSQSSHLQGHRSADGTDYRGLAKLRPQARLKLSYALREGWSLESSVMAWHDFAYQLRDEEFTADVLSSYESEFQLQDGFIQGRLSRHWDIKLGRQVASWGFADSLRVLDVLNPLDNREPGLADIEDLRLPVAMARLDYYRAPWQLSLFAVPEQRFSLNPPFGSDFYSIVDSQGHAIRLREERPDSLDSIDYAAAITGRFSGWDLSLHAARLWRDTPYLDGSDFNADDPNATETDFYAAAVLRHSRINLFGIGLQATAGSWLFKHELALLDNVDFTAAQDVASPLGQLPLIGGVLTGGTDSTSVPNLIRQHDQIDGLVGLEYYGLKQTTLALELAAHWIRNFHPELASAGYRRLNNETALRISRDMFRARLRLSLVAILFAEDTNFFASDDGGLYRVDVSYELTDNWQLQGGIVAYSSGRRQPFTQIGDSDRSQLSVSWSF